MLGIGLGNATLLQNGKFKHNSNKKCVSRIGLNSYRAFKHNVIGSFFCSAAQSGVENDGTQPQTDHGAAAVPKSKKPLKPPSNLNLGSSIVVARALPRVLLIHTGGTLGMDPVQSYEQDPEGHSVLRSGTGGKYEHSLRPGRLLGNILSSLPELRSLAQLELQIPFNKDSSNVGPSEWIKLATILHKNRSKYDAFLIIHGTDTMSFTSSALSLMLAGFKKPIVLTGSQIPIALPRSDARQNLIDAATCAVASHYPPHVQLQEVAICFGGKLLRGNRSQKINSTTYQAFGSPSHPPLATLGVDIEWNRNSLLHLESALYRPRLNLNPQVIRISVIPGLDPRTAYGDLYSRGVRGVILEAFGVGNLPDRRDGWLPWLREQRNKGMHVYMRSQSSLGPLAPHLYRSGSAALKMGVEAGPQMTPECAVVKMMLCLQYPDVPMGMPLAGEM